LNVTAGTVKKSTEARLRMWLSRNVRQVCDGGLFGRTTYFDTVAWESQCPASGVPRESAARPREVGLGHPADERSDLRGDRRAAGPALPALPGPEELEASPMPPDHRLGLDDGDGLHPAVPQAGEQDPDRMKRLAIP
jgi:hypothetical protein